MRACPSDDILGAHLQRALDVDETARVTAHLDVCASCRDIVIAAVRGGVVARAPALAAGTPSQTATVAGPAWGRHAGPMIGAMIGRYELKELLGAGGMGRVYAAYDVELDRTIALKVMRPELAASAGKLAERLVRESRLMAKVSHPAVITVHDVGRTDDDVFIAMEMIRGETLGSYVRRVQPGWRETLVLLARAGRGLAAAHAAGIVHRDFKPENVLVEQDGEAIKRVVVTDFGVARAFDMGRPQVGLAPPGPKDVHLTTTGTIVGTPAYMAPEQLDGQTVDTRADVFAFAVTAWEMVFRVHPFPAQALGEIRAMMQRPPVQPRRHAVPARVVRILLRGLALAPAERWPDLDGMVDALERAIVRRRPIAWLAGGGVALALAGGLWFALGAGSNEDPCRRVEIAFEQGVGERLAAFHAVLRAAEADAVASRVTDYANAWRATHRATCRADAQPIQPATTSACLEARRLELAAVIDDMISGGAEHAKYGQRLARLVQDPARCTNPAPGLALSRVPEDPVLRRQVTALRYRLFDGEEARDAGKTQAALDIANAMRAEAAKLWPQLEVEATYLLATVHAIGGNSQQGQAMLRETAALAERVHSDYLAAAAWILLAQGTAFDEGDPPRALEYLTYADAAAERIGRPDATMAMLEYTRGAVLIEADRSAEGEAALWRAFAVSQRGALEYMPQIVQGFGYLYEDRGRFAEAIDAYRRALVQLGDKQDNMAVVIRDRLAVSLSAVGKVDEAEIEARTAVALGERALGPDNVDRALTHTNLASVLQQAGKLEAALAEMRIGAAAIERVLGERSERYGEVLALEGTILVDLGRFAEADKLYERACDIIAFGVGAEASPVAECWIEWTRALYGLGRLAEGLALIEKALPIIRHAYGEEHAELANVYLTRGAFRAELSRPGARADLERAYAMFADDTLDPGHLASAETSLGQLVYAESPKRGCELVKSADARFAKATASWRARHEVAKAWLAAHPTCR
ncbi:MAG: serine/threonine-protein kinase [Kofleriaceae bacterium]|nr:serine/threonine-protein kinase [Kofleriaceae bacterium]